MCETERGRQVRQCHAPPAKKGSYISSQARRFVPRRYASLYFLACVDEEDNELIVLETIHHFVEVRKRAHCKVYLDVCSSQGRHTTETIHHVVVKHTRQLRHSFCPMMAFCCGLC